MKKGFTYIITTMIIIILISSIFIIFNPVKKTVNTTPNILAKNYEIEFLKLSSSNPTIQDINNLNYGFKKFTNSNNYDVKICSIVENQTSIILSNYTSENCNLVIDGMFSGVVYDNSTVTIDRFINNTNIYLCSCYYAGGKNVYYIDIYNENSKTILKN